MLKVRLAGEQHIDISRIMMKYARWEGRIVKAALQEELDESTVANFATVQRAGKVIE